MLVHNDRLFGPSGVEVFFSRERPEEGCTRWHPIKVYYLAGGGRGREIGSAENIGLIWGHP